MFKVINEDRMLKLIHNFFENPQTLIVELVQNAVRSKAKNITISTDNGRLSAVDDGNGCDLIAPLLTLAESNWDKEIEENQQPAGWGLFVLYCLTKEVEITSKFGTLGFNTELFLKDAAYRNNVFCLSSAGIVHNVVEIGTISPTFIDPIKKVDGFQIVATLKNAELEQKIMGINDTMLQFFPINISINGKNIERATVGEVGKDYVIKTSYMGNDVLVGTKYGNFPRSASDFTVIWYGMQIPPKDILYSHATINVTQGLPLTPVLPFRTDIKQDEKYVHFWDFVRQEIVDYCIGQINNNTTDQLSLSLMRTMGDIATQEELNRLDRFYVVKTQPYYVLGDSFYCDEPDASVIVTKEDKVISNDIEVRLVESGKRQTLKLRSFSKTKKYVGDYEQIFLPEGTIVQYKTWDNYPEWLKIETCVHKVEIHIQKNAKKYRGNLDWHKARIVSDMKLSVIGIDEDCSLDNTIIYYNKDAAEVWDLQYPIVHHFHSDDGDTFDTQESWINEQIREDLQNINGNYSKYELLEGFQKVSNIKCDNIKNIAIDKKKITVTLNRGRKKVLSLA